MVIRYIGYKMKQKVVSDLSKCRDLQVSTTPIDVVIHFRVLTPSEIVE